MDGSGGTAHGQPAGFRIIRSDAVPLCGAVTRLQLGGRTCRSLQAGKITHPNRAGDGCESQLTTAMPVHAARTKVILSFIVGAYGACRIRHAIVLTPNTKPPVERDTMNFAALPDGRAARSPHTPAYADRRNGQLTNAQRPPRVPAAAQHLSNGAHDRSARTPRAGTARSGSVDVGQGKSMSSMTTNRPADHSAAVPATEADHRQADYFLRLLTHSFRRVDHRIDGYQRAIATAETSGAVDHACGIQRMMLIEEQERQTLKGLIDRLQRRFPVRPSGEVTSAYRRDWLLPR